MSKSMEPRLSFLVLRCRDIELTREFYAALGVEFVQEQHGSGPLHYAAELNGLVLELYPQKSKPFVTETMRLGLTIRNLHEVLSRIPLESQVSRDSQDIFISRDPDGRIVELASN